MDTAVLSVLIKNPSPLVFHWRSFYFSVLKHKQLLVNPFLPKMSIFVHQIQALQFQANPSEKFVQKRIPLFLKSLYRSMMVAKPRKNFQPLFLQIKKKNVFFKTDFRKTHRRLKIWVAYTKSGLLRLKS